MAADELKVLYSSFDGIRHENGEEFWYARDLYPILGYTRWESFLDPISRAKEACERAGGETMHHFRDMTKMITLGKGGEREVQDIKLTRYACYLIAINGDPRKEPIAFAQAYFITKTRQLEVLEQRMLEIERLDSRDKLKLTEKEFASVMYTRGVDGRGIAEIKSIGDQALFGGRTTSQMKDKLRIPDKSPLADFLPNVTLKAKDLATAMTTENARSKNLRNRNPILQEHVQNNRAVREALTKTGIFPEHLPAAENIKKIEARHKSERRELERRHKEELAKASRGRNLKS